MLRPMTIKASRDLRDAVESDLQDATSAAVRSWLQKVLSAARTALRNDNGTLLAAAAEDGLPTLGEIQAWWVGQVDTALTAAVQDAMARVWRRYTDKGFDLSDPSLEGTRDFLASVRNRIVAGTHMGVTAPEAAFDAIRVTMADSFAEGWSRSRTAQHIAAQLGWEKNATYWRSEKDRIDREMDSILDPLGPPGNPAREQARLHDPAILRLREQRNLAISHLDAEESIWRTRANLIARTEATGAASYGAQEAFRAEGVLVKVWVATPDRRTRTTHRMASGQAVGLEESFLVGGYRLPFPGFPGAPVQEVAGCRCTMMADENLTPEQRKAVKAISEDEERQAG